MSHTSNTPQAHTPTLDAALQRLDKLVGTWQLTGDAVGTVRHEWMEGGAFLLQHVDLDLFGTGPKASR